MVVVSKLDSLNEMYRELLIGLLGDEFHGLLILDCSGQSVVEFHYFPLHNVQYARGIHILIGYLLVVVTLFSHLIEFQYLACWLMITTGIPSMSA